MLTHFLILAVYITLIFIGLTEGLYYLNFSPLSFFQIWEKILPAPYNFIIAPLILIAFFFLLGLLINAFFPKFSGIRNYVVVSLIILALGNLAISFDSELMKKMTLLGQVSLFFTIIITFNTFFYSIFYHNLVK